MNFFTNMGIEFLRLLLFINFLLVNCVVTLSHEAYHNCTCTKIYVKKHYLFPRLCKTVYIGVNAGYVKCEILLMRTWQIIQNLNWMSCQYIKIVPVKHVIESDISHPYTSVFYLRCCQRIVIKNNVTFDVW